MCIGTYVWNKNLLKDGPLVIEEFYYTDSLQSSPNILPGLVFHFSFWNDQIMIQLSSNKHVIGSYFTDRLIIHLKEIISNSSN